MFGLIFVTETIFAEYNNSFVAFRYLHSLIFRVGEKDRRVLG